MSSTAYWIGLVSIFAFGFIAGKYVITPTSPEVATIHAGDSHKN